MPHLFLKKYISYNYYITKAIKLLNEGYQF